MAWTNYLTDINGRAGLVMFDERFRGAELNAQLPRLVWVGVYCREAPGAAFWDPEETTALDAVEDTLPNNGLDESRPPAQRV